MNYDELLAPAAKAMRPSGIRKFFDLAADMPHCISLGVGEPDFKTPWSVRDAGIRSLELGRTKYTANSGLKELRGEICNYLQRRFDLHYKEENILVTVGGSEAIDLTIRAVVQPGDEVIIPEPCFVCYEPITQLTGCGIAPEDQPAVFDRYFHTTADTKHDSTGLGLTIAQELAHLHRGEILLQSEPGKGSCFTLCLPLLDAE